MNPFKKKATARYRSVEARLTELIASGPQLSHQARMSLAVELMYQLADFLPDFQFTSPLTPQLLAWRREASAVDAVLAISKLEEAAERIEADEPDREDRRQAALMLSALFTLLVWSDEGGESASDRWAKAADDIGGFFLYAFAHTSSLLVPDKAVR